MSKENLKQKWASYEPKLNKNVENLIWGLFKESQCPFFDKGKVSAGLIDEFAKDKEVQFLAFEFVTALREIWTNRFPGMPKPVPNFRPTPDLITKPMEFQPLQTAPLALPPTRISSAASLVESAPVVQTNQPQVGGGPVTNQSTNGDPASASPLPAPSEAAMTLAPPPPSAPLATTHQTMNSGATGAPILKPGHVPSNSVRSANVPNNKPTFHLPNCKVGKPFSAIIEGSDKSGREIVVVDLRFPEGFGLTFDPITQIVVGQPQLDGEFDLDLQWSFADSPGKVSGTCKLTSNPDPRSLWKVIEPAAGLPYTKTHLDQKSLIGNGFRLAAASRRGRSHEHGGSFRDDDFFIYDDRSSGWSVMIVADGAGSAPYSREGSRLAVETAGKNLVDGLTGEFGSKISDYLSAWDSDPSSQKSIGTEFHYFFHSMAGMAVQAIEQEAQSQNAPAKSYSTTLLVAAVKKDGANTFLATFWMGDGAIAAYGPQGTVKLMGTPDGGEFAGQTRFLDRNALADQGFGKRVRVGRLQNVSSVVLMTDGVSDPYFETDNGLADPANWDVLWSEIQPLLSDVEPEKLLVDWLHFFKQGHHDDRTIALLW